jgi:hypothetical protein
MSSARARVLYGVVAAGWAASVCLGLTGLWMYESTPSRPAKAPAEWPAGTHLARQAGLPSLVLFAHPHCPCTRATLGELARLMTECRGKLTTTVVLVRPAGLPDGWERTDLWNGAAAIPGVSVVTDDKGIESQRFGALTSGQALLYSSDGRLLFAGGITQSRGHQGDNAGESAIAALVLGGGRLAKCASTPVYGCPLFDESSSCMKDMKEGAATCQMK